MSRDRRRADASRKVLGPVLTGWRASAQETPRFRAELAADMRARWKIRGHAESTGYRRDLIPKVGNVAREDAEEAVNRRRNAPTFPRLRRGESVATSPTHQI